MPETIISIINRIQQGKDPRKSMVLPSRKGDRLGRRRINKKFYINFWDLGMVSTGEGAEDWEMLAFQPSICPFGTSSETLDTTQHDELLDKLFEVPVEDWADYCKRIIPDMNYPMTLTNASVESGSFSESEPLNSSNPNFTDNGLKISPLWYTGYPYVPTIGIGDGIYPYIRNTRFSGENATTTGNIVTSTYEINGPQVEFTPSGDMDIFLVPALPMQRAYFEYQSGGSFGDPYYKEELNAFFWLADRGIALTPSHPLYQQPAGGFDNRTGNNGSQAGLDAFFTVTSYLKDQPGSRGRYATTSGGALGSADDGSAFGGTLPGTYTYVVSGAQMVYAQAAISSNSFMSGSPGTSTNQIRLRCVIRKDDEYFYFWNRIHV